MRLLRACRENQSVLILGPAGSGKTALAARVLAELSGGRDFYVSAPEGLRGLLRALVASLHAAGDASLPAELRAEHVAMRNFSRWLAAQSSSRLKGALYRAAGHSPFRIFLDHVSHFTRAEAKVMEELASMHATPVYCLVHKESEPAAELLHKIYWNPASRLRLGPLPERAARQLLEQAIQEHGLERFELRDFRRQVLRLSGGLPGAILTMCTLAGQPRYHSGRRIMTRLVYVDYKMTGASSAARERFSAVARRAHCAPR